MMRRSILLALAGAALAAAAFVAKPYAQPTEPAQAPFIRFGSEVKYRVAKSSLAPSRLGLAAAELADGKSEISAVRGEVKDALPDGWAKNPLEGASSGKMPLAAKFRSGKCKCETQIGDDKKERIAALYAEAEFTVAADQVVELLELRARYRDGISISINGREVIRRNIDGDAEPLDTARRPRGPEVESFFVPVTPGLLKTGANALRIEVRPSGHRESPSLDFELVARQGPRIVRGPIVSRTDSDVVVIFDTDLPVAASVEYGQTNALGKTMPTAGGALAVRHRVRIPASPDTAIHYRIVAGHDASPTYAVATRPKKGEVVRFGVYGDMRGGHVTHGKIVKALLREAPDFVIVTGDLVLRGSDGGDWQRFFAVARELLARTPYYPAAGNHDMGRSGEERRLMIEQFPLPPGPKKRPHWASWYSFDVADIHFVMLDSNAYRATEQLEWLKKDLADAKARGVRATFAATHDGPYSRGIHRGNRYAAKTYAPVLAEGDVTMLFSGHDHLYQRGEVNGLRYVVSGGGGAPLYPVRCGIPGKRRCRVDDGMKKVASEYHYVIVTVFANKVRLCPKRPNRTALEKCFTIKI